MRSWALFTAILLLPASSMAQPTTAPTTAPPPAYSQDGILTYEQYCGNEADRLARARAELVNATGLSRDIRDADRKTLQTVIDSFRMTGKKVGTIKELRATKFYAEILGTNGYRPDDVRRMPSLVPRAQEELDTATQLAEACELRLKHRLDVRAKAAALLSEQELEAIPQQYRIEAETTRLTDLRSKRQEEERAAQQAKDDARRDEEQRKQQEYQRALQIAEEEMKRDQANPKIMRLVFSSEVCFAKAKKREVLAQIAKEKHYARVGGVLDAQSMFQLQQQLRWTDDVRSDAMAELRKIHLRFAGCANRQVKQAAMCLSENFIVGGRAPKYCDSKDIVRITRLADVN